VYRSLTPILQVSGALKSNQGSPFHPGGGERGRGG